MSKQWGEQEAVKTAGMVRFLASKAIIKPTQTKQTKLRLTPLPVNKTKTENEKRKVEYTYQEFKRDCKRLRPEFGNDEDEEFNHNPPQHAGLRQVPHKQIIFFSVFSKENARKNHEIMFSRQY